MSDCEEKHSCQETRCREEEAEKCHEESDLVEHVAGMWKSAGCKAFSGVVEEILKEKIRARWGSELEKGAEAFVGLLEASWQARIAKAKAGAEFRKALEKSLLG